MTSVTLEVESPEPGPPTFRSRLAWVLPLAVLYAADKLLAALFAALGIQFPSPLLGMALIVLALLAAARSRPAAADAAEAFFQPGVDTIHKWLPTLYIPALVSLPLAVQPLAGVTLVKAAALVCLGFPLVLWFTAGVTVLVRRTVSKAQMEHFPYHAPAMDFTWRHWAAWGAVAAVSLLLTAVLPSRTAPLTAFPFLLSTTVLGYLLGMALPSRVQVFVHPTLICAAVPNTAAALHGFLTGQGYWRTLEGYLTKGRDGYGPGDLLFSFLGVIILSFGLKVYEQWAVMRRHAAEILAATASSALFSLLTTACMARAAGLPPDVARGMVPRSVTMALALPIAAQLGAPLPITAAAVALTGIAGSAGVQPLLDLARFSDPIARGLAAAAAAHGLGTAALAAREPDALPYCALSYALCGVMSTLWAQLPPVRAVLLAITG